MTRKPNRLLSHPRFGAALCLAICIASAVLFLLGCWATTKAVEHAYKTYLEDQQ